MAKGVVAVVAGVGGGVEPRRREGTKGGTTKDGKPYRGAWVLAWVGDGVFGGGWIIGDNGDGAARCLGWVVAVVAVVAGDGLRGGEGGRAWKEGVLFWVGKLGALGVMQAQGGAFRFPVVVAFFSVRASLSFHGGKLLYLGRAVTGISTRPRTTRIAAQLKPYWSGCSPVWLAGFTRFYRARRV